MHSTNYFNTFIEVAEDSAADAGTMPPEKGNKKTIANMQFDMLIDSPYQFTSDEVIFTIFATRKEFAKEEWDEERQHFFSKGQPCFRASPLTKSYGWGVHFNEEGKMAIVGKETNEYQGFLKDNSLKKWKAMRSKRN